MAYLIDELKWRLRRALGTIIGCLLVAYFSYHLVQGDFGLIAHLQLKATVAEAQIVRDEVAAERSAWEHRVALLRPDNLDPDLLEERARAMLSYAFEDDLVVFYEDPS